MKNIIILLLILIFSSYAMEKQGVFRVELSYQNNSLFLDDIRLIDYLDYKAAIEQEEGYKIELVSVPGDVLKSYYFNVPREAFIDGEKGGELVDLDYVEFSIFLPYYPNSNIINIYDTNGIRVIKADVSKYAKEFCGDGICQGNEACKEDCKLNKKIDEKKVLLYSLIIIIFLLILFVLKGVKKGKLKR